MIEIIYKDINTIKPYSKNPRDNKNAIEGVKKSIEEYGFLIPIVLDKDNTIVCGHTRYEASKLLKLKKVPCVIANDLDEIQIKAFRLVDNKVHEFATWNIDKLFNELEFLPKDLFTGMDFAELENIGNELVEELRSREPKEKNDTSSLKMRFVLQNKNDADNMFKELKEVKGLEVKNNW